MPIGNCDCCDLRDVPGSAVDVPGMGEPFACYLCQGDAEADPYHELPETRLLEVVHDVCRAFVDAAVIAAFVSAVAVWALIGTGAA